MAIVHKTASSITIITKNRTIKIDTSKYKLRRKVRQRNQQAEEDTTTIVSSPTEGSAKEEGNMVSITDFIPQFPPYSICTGVHGNDNGGYYNNGDGYGDNGNGNGCEDDAWTPLSYFNPLNAMTFYSGTAAGPGGFWYEQQQNVLENGGCYYYPPAPNPSMYATPSPPPPPPCAPPSGFQLPPITEELESNAAFEEEYDQYDAGYDVAYCMPKFASAPAPNVDPLRTLMGTTPSPKLKPSSLGVIGDSAKGSGGLKAAPPGLKIPTRLRSFYRHGEPGVTWDGKGPNPFGPISPPRLPLPWRRKGNHKYGLGSKVLLDPDEEPECRELDELVKTGEGGSTVVMVPLFSGTGFGYSVLCPPRKGRTWTCCECSQLRHFADGNVCGKDCHRFCGECLAYVEQGREEEFIRWRDGEELPEHEKVYDDTIPVEPEQTLDADLIDLTSPVVEKYIDDDDDKDSIYHDCMSTNSTDTEDDEDDDRIENDDVFSNVSQSPPDSKATSLHEHSDEEADTLKNPYPSSDEAEPEPEPQPEWYDGDNNVVQFQFDDEENNNNNTPLLPPQVNGHPTNLKELIGMQMLIHRKASSPWRCCGGASSSPSTSPSFDSADADDEGGQTVRKRKRAANAGGCGTTWRSRATGRCLNCGHRRCEVCDEAAAV